MHTRDHRRTDAVTAADSHSFELWHRAP